MTKSVDFSKGVRGMFAGQKKRIVGAIDGHLDCDECGTMTETRTETVNYPRRGFTVTLDNVEVEVCPRCGARYFNASSIDDMNRRAAIPSE
jgi:YgiT-type zinc finger domain-containing protein